MLLGPFRVFPGPTQPVLGQLTLPGSLDFTIMASVGHSLKRVYE